MHSMNRISVDDPNFIQTKSVLCIWQAHESSKPIRVMSSQGNISKGCVCILKNSAILCGTKEGILQLWDVKKSFGSCLENNVIKEPKEYYLEEYQLNEGQCILTSLEAVSESIVASLDNRGTVDLW